MPGQAPLMAQPPRTNGFAVTSLVLGIVGVSLLSFIFGLVALSQIKRYPGQGGRGMAIAGICLSLAWAAASVVLFIVLVQQAQNDPYGGY